MYDCVVFIFRMILAQSKKWFSFGTKKLIIFFLNFQDPSKIRIIPKTATLKHKQLSVAEIPASLNKSSSNIYQNHSSNSSGFGSLSSSNFSSSYSKGNTLLANASKSATNSQQPFELTIRVDVTLPFNQRNVVRVKPDISLEDLLSVIAQESSLDKSRYDLLVYRVDDNTGEKRLAQTSMNDAFQKYNTKEVTLALKGSSAHAGKTQSKILECTLLKRLKMQYFWKSYLLLGVQKVFDKRNYSF